MFTLLDLFALQAFLSPLFTCLLAGWRHAGWFGLLISGLIALVPAVASFGSIRAFGRWLGRYPALSGARPGVGWVAFSWLLCVAMAAWIVGLSVLGYFLIAGYVRYPTT